jgi:hypothetical protein
MMIFDFTYSHTFLNMMFSQKSAIQFYEKKLNPIDLIASLI